MSFSHAVKSISQSVSQSVNAAPEEPRSGPRGGARRPWRCAAAGWPRRCAPAGPAPETHRERERERDERETQRDTHGQVETDLVNCEEETHI
jgi:hypothetical protein